MAQEESAIKTIPATIKWQDAFHLSIKDPVLKKHVEGFLNRMEKSSFQYELENTDTGKIEKNELSGQGILNSVKLLANSYADPAVFPKLQQALKTNDIDAVAGKITITDHNRPYDGTARNGSNTAFLDKPGTLPVAIQLGTEYLKGAKYLGDDGKYHAVTVDGVLANEIGHVAYRTDDDTLSEQVEVIIASAMGAPQRKIGHHYVEFKKDSNNGYQTLYDKLPADKAKQTQKTEKPKGAEKPEKPPINEALEKTKLSGLISPASSVDNERSGTLASEAFSQLPISTQITRNG